MNQLFFQLPHNKTDTSQAAAESQKPHFNRLERQVLRVISQSPDGMTADEIELMTELGGNTVRPRIWALTRRGLLRDSGKRRLTRKGRKAVVHVCA